MRGRVGGVHEYSYIVLNWLKRRGIVEKEEKEEEVNKRKWTEEGTEKEQ